MPKPFVRTWHKRIADETALWVCRIAFQSSKLADEVRFLDGALEFSDHPVNHSRIDSANVLGVFRIAHDPAKVGDQVQFLAGALEKRSKIRRST